MLLIKKLLKRLANLKNTNLSFSADSIGLICVYYSGNPSQLTGSCNLMFRKLALVEKRINKNNFLKVFPVEEA